MKQFIYYLLINVFIALIADWSSSNNSNEFPANQRDAMFYKVVYAILLKIKVNQKSNKTPLYSKELSPRNMRAI